MQHQRLLLGGTCGHRVHNHFQQMIDAAHDGRVILATIKNPLANTCSYAVPLFGQVGDICVDLSKGQISKAGSHDVNGGNV